MRSTQNKTEAIRLRRLGKSYSEIAKLVGVSSKGTISYWLKGLALSTKENARLHANMELAHKRGLYRANKARSERIYNENNEYYEAGKQIMKKFSPANQDLVLLGVSLYWAEGSKTIDENRSPSLVFSNSDPKMIAIFIKFLLKILNVKSIRIKSGIHIYPSIDEQEARKYWSQFTKLPLDRYYIVNQISRASKMRRGHTLPYGTLALKVHGRREFYIMKGMIDWLRKSM